MVAVSKEIEARARAQFLTIAGMLWDGDETIVLLIPREPGFWVHFTKSAEYLDGEADPLDRWSKRIAWGIARDLDLRAEFPSDGPPYPPFIRWMKASGRAWVSPVQMMVHDTAGMMVSLRAALRVPGRLPLAPLAGQSPCETCVDQPCTSSCPVGALSADIYDVTACQTHLRTPEGESCMSHGCLARRACPVSQISGRTSEQSAFHMQAFLPS